MNKANSEFNQLWVKQDEQIYLLEKNFIIPDYELKSVPWVEVDDIQSLNEIPNKGGAYWIWTDEAINHKLHKNEIPAMFKGGRIIYNGVAKDNVRSRIFNHLFGDEENGWSAISIDLYKHISNSHRKKAMSTSTSNQVRVAYLQNNTRINTKDKLKELHLNEQEVAYIDKTDYQEYYFRNGIDRREEKHKTHRFIVYFIAELNSTTYLEFLEKRWRKLYGLPQLCSYISGR